MPSIRFLLLALTLIIPGMLAIPSLPAAAQNGTGALCVAAYADANGNGLREENEISLGGVNVNLSTGGAIIATHITAGNEEQFCFENLAAGIYSLTFTESPTYRMTTSNEGTYSLDAEQRLTIAPFGAVPVPLDALRAEVAAQIVAADSDEEPLETSMRLLLSTAASLAVMVIMIGMGAVILSMTGWSRRRA